MDFDQFCILKSELLFVLLTRVFYGIPTNSYQEAFSERTCIWD